MWAVTYWTFLKTSHVRKKPPPYHRTFLLCFISALFKAVTDGGTDRLFSCVEGERNNYIPDIITGDFDSATRSVLDFYRQKVTANHNQIWLKICSAGFVFSYLLLAAVLFIHPLVFVLVQPLVQTFSFICSSVQSSPSTDWVIWGGGWGHEGHFSRDPLPVFSAGGCCEQFWHGRGCPLFEVIHPAFPLPTTASPTLQGTLKDGFGEAVMACDIPKPCELPSLDSCRKVPVGLQGSWSCSTPSAASKRCREVSSGTWFWKPGSFS